MNHYACLHEQRFGCGPYEIVTIQPEDIENIRIWRNAQMDVLRQSEPITAIQQIEYYSAKIWPQLESRHPREILFSLFRDGRHIGYGGLVHIAWLHRRAEVSFLVEPERAADRVVYGEDFHAFLGLIKKVAFADLRLNRIFTETYAIRGYHISILESAGLNREGVLLEHIYIDGNPVDSIMHGFLSSDYER